MVLHFHKMVLPKDGMVEVIPLDIIAVVVFGTNQPIRMVVVLLTFVMVVILYIIEY